MSTSIILKKVSYSIEDRVLLHDISVSIKAGERVLIVGENGAGKSTFMKLCLDVIQPDSGTIERPRSLISYVSQEFHPKGETVNEYIEQNVHSRYRAKAADIMNELGFSKGAYEKKTSELSGGQQKILSLSCALAQNPSFLFLDEPENHLDIVSRMKLIELLDEFRGALVMVSHDRQTVDSLSEKVFEVEKGNVHVTEGSYSDYLLTRLRRIEGAQREYDERAKKIKKLADSVRIMGKIAFRGGGVANYQNRKRELEGMKQEHNSQSRAEDRKTTIKLVTKGDNFHSGKLICNIKDLSFAYPGQDKPIIKKTNMEIRAGKKIVLLGRNGCGKSTLLKCLTEEFTPTTGSITWGNEVTYAYFNQHAVFSDDMLAVEVAMEELQYRDDEARRVLGSVKFTTEKMLTKVGELSGGERMRLRFACAFGKKPDFLILDEPTNHLDETTWEILLSVSKNFTGTLLLVSHDYRFIEELEPDYFWVLHDKVLEERHKDLENLLEEIR